MINPVARIYPMYLLTQRFWFLLIFLFVEQYWNIEKTKEFLLSITMTKALFEDYFLAGIPQG